MDLEAFPQVNSRKTEGFRRKRDPCIVDRSGGQCFIDPPVGGLLAAVDALRVHPQQHLHTVTCMFRMAHVFLALGQIDQAHHVATSTAQALEPKITQDAEPEVLSLYGALHLVLAVAAARDNKRAEAHQHLETARKIAGQLGEDRDDDGTEFGPTNVAIHAVNIAVELGDAGQAIELGQHVTAASLSPERQARYWLDLA